MVQHEEKISKGNWLIIAGFVYEHYDDRITAFHSAVHYNGQQAFRDRKHDARCSNGILCGYRSCGGCVDLDQVGAYEQ